MFPVGAQLPSTTGKLETLKCVLVFWNVFVCLGLLTINKCGKLVFKPTGYVFFHNPCVLIAISWHTSHETILGTNTMTKSSGYLRDVFLWLVELLLQVAGRSLAGDFDHGQLFVVAGHVARRPAHAVTALHCWQFSFMQERWCRDRWGVKLGDERGWVEDDEHKEKMLF